MDNREQAELAKDILQDIKDTYPGVRWLYNQPKWSALEGRSVSRIQSFVEALGYTRHEPADPDWAGARHLNLDNIEEPAENLVEKVEKELDRPISCEDGRAHYIDESNKRYLVSEILKLCQPELKGLSDGDMQMLADWVENCKLSLADENKSRAMVIDSLWNIEKFIRAKRHEAHDQQQIKGE